MAHYKTGMVFGVFDGLHDGHKYFLQSAKELCELLVVVVAKDSASFALKGRLPTHPLSARMNALQAFKPEYTIISGDEKVGEWSAIKKHAPDVVILGYDQKMMSDEFAKLDIPFLFLKAHKPEKFKSSIISKFDTKK